jgi:Flp pilus assembly protein TadD
MHRWHKIGNGYTQSGLLADAVQEFKAVQLLRPHDIVSHRQIAEFYLGVPHARNGDKTSARRDFEHALTLDPQHDAARANLARL